MKSWILLFLLSAKPVSIHIMDSELQAKWRLIKSLCKALVSESCIYLVPIMWGHEFPCFELMWKYIILQ